MSQTLIKYNQIQKQIETLTKAMSAMEDNPEFQREVEFSKKLNALLAEYDKSPGQVAQLLLPDEIENIPVKKPRRQRTRKEYTNPHTGEKVITAGGNNNVLKKWRTEHPDVNFSDWITNEDA